MRILVPIFVLLLCACQAPLPPPLPLVLDASFDCPDNFITDSLDHMVRLNKNGLVTNQDRSSVGVFGKLSADALRRRDVGESFQRTVCAAEQLAREKNISKRERTTVKMLVFVHGGLNSFGATDRRIETTAPRIVGDRDDWHYPVFVSWPSDALSTYLEQSFSIREGRPTNAMIGVMTSPIMIASDLLRSVGNYPSTFYYQFTTEKDRFASIGFNKPLSRAWKEAAEKVCDNPENANGICSPIPEPKVVANRSTFVRNNYNTTYNAVTTLPTSTVRYTIGSLWHSGISQSSWDNMKRRTQNIFYPPHSFDARQEQGVAGGQFFEFLLDRAQFVAANRKMDYEITLVGHSMGAIVINTALEKDALSWASSGALKRVVYMAGAASINETLEAVGPVLETATRLQQPIDFHNLTLNRVAEISEAHYWGVVPLGSLLVSIDQHHDKPVHPLERTVGSETNIHTSIDIIDQKLRSSGGKLIFKSFDRCPGQLPAKHGDFGSLAFWKEVTWGVGNTGCDERKEIL